MARAWHLTSRPEGLPTAENFALKDYELPELGDGMVHVRNLLAVGRPLHARADERGEVLHPAVRARRADGGRRARRGRRIQCRGLRARRPGRAHGRLARRGRASRQGAAQGAADPRRRAAGVPRHPRHARRDRLFRAVRRRSGQGRRPRVRLGGGRRGRLGGGADGQGQGHDRHRLRARRGEMRFRPLARRRRGDRLHRRAADRKPARGGARRHRRLFRQCRRRPSRRRFRPRPAQRALRLVRDDRRLQQPRADGFRYIIRVIAMRITVRGFLYGDYVSRLGEFYAEVGAWVASGKVKSHDTDRRRPRAGAGRLPRPVQRRQHRQDAGSESSARSCSSPGCRSAVRGGALPCAAPSCRG